MERLTERIMMMGETEILANYVATGKYEDLPVEVVAHTKKIV
jgi:hypothetical protein